MNDEYQTILKTEWLTATKGTYTVQCKKCGRFVSVFDDIGDKKTLYCENCDIESTVPYLSYKNVNRYGFVAIWYHQDKHDSIKIWKESVCGVHSFDSYKKLEK